MLSAIKADQDQLELRSAINRATVQPTNACRNVALRPSEHLSAGVTGAPMLACLGISRKQSSGKVLRWSRTRSHRPTAQQRSSRTAAN